MKLCSDSISGMTRDRVKKKVLSTVIFFPFFRRAATAERGMETDALKGGETHEKNEDGGSGSEQLK